MAPRTRSGQRSAAHHVFFHDINLMQRIVQHLIKSSKPQGQSKLGPRQEVQRYGTRNRFLAGALEETFEYTASLTQFALCSKRCLVTVLVSCTAEAPFLLGGPILRAAWTIPLPSPHKLVIPACPGLILELQNDGTAWPDDLDDPVDENEWAEDFRKRNWHLVESTACANKWLLQLVSGVRVIAPVIGEPAKLRRDALSCVAAPLARLALQGLDATRVLHVALVVGREEQYRPLMHDGLYDSEIDDSDVEDMFDWHGIMDLDDIFDTESDSESGSDSGGEGAEIVEVGEATGSGSASGSGSGSEGIVDVETAPLFFLDTDDENGSDYQAGSGAGEGSGGSGSGDSGSEGGSGDGNWLNIEVIMDGGSEGGSGGGSDGGGSDDDGNASGSDGESSDSDGAVAFQEDEATRTEAGQLAVRMREALAAFENCQSLVLRLNDFEVRFPARAVLDAAASSMHRLQSLYLRYFEYTDTFHPGVDESVRDAPAPSETLARLAQLTSLRYLGVDMEWASDDEQAPDKRCLSHLSGLQHLRFLSFEVPEMYEVEAEWPDVVQDIRALPPVAELRLAGILHSKPLQLRAPESGSGAPELRSLVLSNTDFVLQPGVFDNAAKLAPTLKSLELCAFSEAALSKSMALTGLTRLVLHGLVVEDEEPEEEAANAPEVFSSLERVSDMRDLATLEVFAEMGTLSRKALPAIGHLPRLTELELHVEMLYWPHLENLTQLQCLTRVSVAQACTPGTGLPNEERASWAWFASLPRLKELSVMPSIETMLHDTFPSMRRARALRHLSLTMVTKPMIHVIAGMTKLVSLGGIYHHMDSDQHEGFPLHLDYSEGEVTEADVELLKRVLAPWNYNRLKMMVNPPSESESESESETSSSSGQWVMGPEDGQAD
ncbi:unnamed protein product [Pedinophyceae sp. YPF-701]|nr:unnamed protein product [Pedinophyceae sp. YPF-701]